MKMIKRNSIASLVGLAALASSGSLLAQGDDAQEGAVALEEVMVTAQRRSQNLQDVANSVDAVSGADIDALSKVNFEDYINSIGGVGFTKNGNGAVKLGIRGVSAVSQDQYAFASTVSTTGLYLNDVAIQGSGTLPDLNLYDLQRVEVLKGPQGTLYGEGAMGGAVRIILNSPDLTEFSGTAEASVFNTKNADAGYRARAMINAPLVEDKLGLRFVISTEDKPGWIDNVRTGEDAVNEAEAFSWRASFLAQLTDNFSAEFLAMHDENESDDFNQQVDGLGDLETNLLEDQFSEREFQLYSLTLKFDLGFAELTSISALHEKESRTRQRVPFSLDEFIFIPGGFGPQGFSENETLSVWDDDETTSQELRLVSMGDETIDWTAGFFYRDRERDLCSPYDSPGALNFNALPVPDFLKFPETISTCPLPPETGVDTFTRFSGETYEQYAVYGEINWELTDNLELTAGARWFDEEVTFYDEQPNYGIFAALSVPSSTNSNSENDVLFKLGLSWTPSEDQLYYFNVAEGFRSGGTNLNGQNAVDPATYANFESDSLINYELGAKTSWADGRVTLNGALFYTDWQDIQSYINVPGTGTQPFIRLLNSAGDGEITGLEAQLTWLASENLTTGLNFTAQEAEFTDPTIESNVVEGSQLPNAPDLTASAFIQYNMQLASGEVYGRAEYTYVDEQRTVVEPLVPTDPRYDDSAVILDSYDLLNFTLGYRADRWFATAYVHNATDERYGLDRVVSLPFTAGGWQPNITVVGTPRQYGLTVGFDF